MPVKRPQWTLGQNPLLKKILSALPSLCPYEGCDAEPKDTELEDHKKICQHRPVNCFMKSCSVKNYTTPFLEFFEHLEEKHVLNRVQNDSTLAYNFGIKINDDKIL